MEMVQFTKRAYRSIIPSLKRKLTPKAYTNIPIPNPINLAGHNNPSKASTVYLVPQI